MYSIVLIGHGDISKGFQSAVEMIVGEQEKFECVILTPDDTPESYLEKLRNVTKESEEILLLADIKGGTPANVASYILLEKDSILIAGINLPLVLEVIMSRITGNSKELAVEKVMRLAQQSVVTITRDDLKRKE